MRKELLQMDKISRLEELQARRRALEKEIDENLEESAKIIAESQRMQSLIEDHRNILNDVDLNKKSREKLLETFKQQVMRKRSK